RSESDFSQLLHAGILAVTDNDMIQNMNSQDISGLYQPFGEQKIVSAWSGIAARMIMYENYTGGSSAQSTGKYFPGMCRCAHQRTHRNIVRHDNLIFCVEQQNFEIFLPQPPHIAHEKSCYAGR